MANGLWQQFPQAAPMMPQPPAQCGSTAPVPPTVLPVYWQPGAGGGCGCARRGMGCAGPDLQAGGGGCSCMAGGGGLGPGAMMMPLLLLALGLAGAALYVACRQSSAEWSE